MSPRKHRVSRVVIRFGLPVLAMFLAGCSLMRRTPLFTDSGPSWRVPEGQALWRPRRGFPEPGGELLFASHPDGRCLAQFTKTPLALASAETTRTGWRPANSTSGKTMERFLSP